MRFRTTAELELDVNVTNYEPEIRGGEFEPPSAPIVEFDLFFVVKHLGQEHLVKVPKQVADDLDAEIEKEALGLYAEARG